MGNDIVDPNIVQMIVKTSLLAFICIAITFTSCIFLILRFTFQVDTFWVNLIGDIFISLDIYTNFIFVVMSFKYFDKYYQIVFGKLDSCFTKKLSTKTNDERQIALGIEATVTNSATSTKV